MKKFFVMITILLTVGTAYGLPSRYDLVENKKAHGESLLAMADDGLALPSGYGIVENKTTPGESLLAMADGGLALPSGYGIVENGKTPGESLLIAADDGSVLQTENDPVENKTTPGESAFVAAETGNALPSRYDLRNYGRMTSVKNQGIPGPCWAFAALGAMESNWLTQGLGKIPDLSELQIAFYSYRDPVKSRNFTSRKSSGTLALEGNVFIPVALMSRLSGPTDEKNLPYTTTITDSQRKSLSRKAPESFRRSMRLRDAYVLTGNSTPGDATKKSLIMNHGAIVVSIYSDLSKYRNKGGHYTYFNNKHGKNTNHDVLLAGWDDNFSRNNFSPKPSRNGAWLVKNSWGSRGNEGGYFWMPYEQYMTGGAAFIVERNNSRLKHYGYDDLGFCRTVKYAYGANVFCVTGNRETLKEVAFYTALDNEKYEVSVYLHGKNKPSSPADGERVATVKGVQEYAGYHTVSLTENVALSEGEYFSVVLRLAGGYMPAEVKSKGYSENAEVKPGQSYFSSDGVKWTDGVNVGGNACVKGFALSR